MAMAAVMPTSIQRPTAVCAFRSPSEMPLFSVYQKRKKGSSSTTCTSRSRSGLSTNHLVSWSSANTPAAMPKPKARLRIHDILAAAAQRTVLRHVRQIAPAPSAFLVVRLLDLPSPVRTVEVMNSSASASGDAGSSGIATSASRLDPGPCRGEAARCVPSRRAKLTQLRPLRRRRHRRGRNLGCSATPEVHGPSFGIGHAPNLFRREHEDWRHPSDKGVEDEVQRVSISRRLSVWRSVSALTSQ